MESNEEKINISDQKALTSFSWNQNKKQKLGIHIHPSQSWHPVVFPFSWEQTNKPVLRKIFEDGVLKKAWKWVLKGVTPFEWPTYSSTNLQSSLFHVMQKKYVICFAVNPFVSFVRIK